MKTYSLTHIADQKLQHDLTTLVARDRENTAELLAHLAEFDARGLYRLMGYPTMRDYCVGELHFSEHAAYRRITAARAARQFPALFAAIADGRLHLSAIGVLAAHLTTKNANDLITAATHKTRAEIEYLMAVRFPKPDVPTRVEPIVTQPVLSTEHVATEEVKELSGSLGLGRVELTSEPAKLSPLAPERFSLQLTIDQETHDLLRNAQELLSHQLPSGDVPEVIKRALRAYVGQLEKQKFAATEKPRASLRRLNAGARYLPAAVKRAVWERDGGQCTFVGKTGHRCSSRKFLEFDHVDEVARGGRASVDRMRLRCRAHNQYTAECAFGAEFMRAKREQAKRAAEEAKTKAAAAERAKEVDVIPCLRNLGFSPDEAKRAAEHCDGFPEEAIEQRVRRALTLLRPRARTVPSGQSSGAESVA